MTDTASPTKWSSLASQDIDLDHTSESQGVPPPAVPDNLPVPTIIQNALGGSRPTYSRTYSQGPRISSPPVVQPGPLMLGGLSPLGTTWVVTRGGGGGRRYDEWTGALCLNGTGAHVRARGNDAINNPYVPAFLKGLLVGD